MMMAYEFSDAQVSIGGVKFTANSDIQSNGVVAHVPMARAPIRVTPAGMTRREHRDFKKKYRKLAKQARCHMAGKGKA